MNELSDLEISRMLAEACARHLCWLIDSAVISGNTVTLAGWALVTEGTPQDARFLVNGVPFTIVGVAPANPVALTPLPVNVYIPTMMLRVGYRWCKDSLASDCNTLGMVGRLAGGRSVAEAAAEFAAIMPERWRHAPIGENRGVAVRQPRGMSEDDEEPRLVATLGAVAILLLVVCCATMETTVPSRPSLRRRRSSTTDGWKRRQ